MTPNTFKQLALAHIDELYDRALRRTGDGDLAADLVQDTYLLAWEAIETLRSTAGIRAWLVRILERRIADHFRTQRRRQTLVPVTRLEAVHEETVATGTAGPLEGTIKTLSDERVLSALARLPEDFAEVVALHDIEGFKYREIAEITNVAIGTVMSRIARGRRLLAAVILEQMDAWDLEVPVPAAPGRTATGEEQ